MPQFSNRPFLATTISFLVIPSKAEGSAVRHWCAPLLSAHKPPPSSPNPHGNTNFPFCHSEFPGVVRGTADPSALLLMTKSREGVFPGGIGLRDPRSQKRDLGHPSISPFDIAEGTSFVISLPTRLSESAARDDKKEMVVARKEWLLNRGIFSPEPTLICFWT